MTERGARIPIYGSITRPSGPDEGLRELREGLLEWSGGEIEITYETDEFTTVCPTTGQPDFGSVKVTYWPDKKYIESKHMKFYLWSFRDFGIHCEKLAERIANEISEATGCLRVQAEVCQNARGGLSLRAVKTIERASDEKD